MSRLPVIFIYLQQLIKRYLNSKWGRWLQQVLLPLWQSAYLPACSTGQYWGHNAPCWCDVDCHRIHPQHRSYLWKKKKQSKLTSSKKKTKKKKLSDWNNAGLFNRLAKEKRFRRCSLIKENHPSLHPRNPHKLTELVWLADFVSVLCELYCFIQCSCTCKSSETQPTLTQNTEETTRTLRMCKNKYDFPIQNRYLQGL